MESQPQNPEFRINPENFHTFTRLQRCTVIKGITGHTSKGIFLRLWLKSFDLRNIVNEK